MAQGTGASGPEAPNFSASLSALSHFARSRSCGSATHTAPGREPTNAIGVGFVPPMSVKAGANERPRLITSEQER
jgi:hypothetical protein